MIAAVFKIMWLRLWRDKGALALAFILPGAIFAIFAAIFANASGGDLDLRVAFGSGSNAPASTAFAEDFQDNALMTILTDQGWSERDIREQVRLGQADAGVYLFGNLADPTTPAIRIFQDPSRKVAATVLKGQIRQTLAASSNIVTPEFFETVSALNETNEAALEDPSVTYYIGATAILFLLFSAMQGAAISIDERRNGISDRLMVGPSGALWMLSGKFQFLSVIGFVQAAIICAVAAIFFHVPILEHLLPLGMACLGAAMLSAGLALLVAALCDTQAQMHTISTFTVLLLSAAGGSMVPRFMMPNWLQSLGQLTPNYWAIEAFYGILARGQTLLDLLHVWGVLFGGAFLALLLAAALSHMMKRV